MSGEPNAEHHVRGQATVSVDVADKDRFAVVVDRIRIRRHDEVPTAPAAPRVVEGLSYLGEPLRMVESEPDEALVRSVTPTPVPGGKQFYEFRFQGAEATMERRRASGDEVSSVPFTVSNETLDRLVDDLGRMIGGEAADRPATRPDS